MVASAANERGSNYPLCHLSSSGAAVEQPGWLLIFKLNSWIRSQSDMAVCSTYPGHSIRGIWPVYFAAICSTLQPRKGPVHHSLSPHVWPLRTEKGAKRRGVETAASSNPGFVESGRERSRTLCNVGKSGGSTKRQCGKDSIYSWPVSCIKLRISEFSTGALG